MVSCIQDQELDSNRGARAIVWPHHSISPVMLILVWESRLIWVRRLGSDWMAWSIISTKYCPCKIFPEPRMYSKWWAWWLSVVEVLNIGSISRLKWVACSWSQYGIGQLPDQCWLSTRCSISVGKVCTSLECDVPPNCSSSPLNECTVAKRTWPFEPAEPVAVMCPTLKIPNHWIFWSLNSFKGVFPLTDQLPCTFKMGWRICHIGLKLPGVSTWMDCWKCWYAPCRCLSLPVLVNVNFEHSDRLQGEYLVQDTAVQLEDRGVSDIQTGFVSIRPTLDLDRYRPKVFFVEYAIGPVSTF